MIGRRRSTALPSSSKAAFLSFKTIPFTQKSAQALPGALLPGTCHLTAGEKASSRSGLLRTSSKPSRLGWELTGSYPSGWLGAACRFCSGSLVVGPCLRSLPLQEPLAKSLQSPFRAARLGGFELRIYLLDTVKQGRLPCRFVSRSANPVP